MASDEYYGHPQSFARKNRYEFGTIDLEEFLVSDSASITPVSMLITVYKPIDFLLI